MNAPHPIPLIPEEILPTARPRRPAPRPKPPLLLLFTSHTSGRGRRLEGFVAHVLQRRHNHESFRVRVIWEEDRPDLFDRFHVATVPSILVVDDKRVAKRVKGFVSPRELEDALQPWLH